MAEISDPLNPSISTVPFIRGPMYSAYSELREWKLRMKKAGLNPTTPIPVQLKRPVVTRSAAEQSMDFRKENRKPPVIAPPVIPPVEVKRAVSKGEERGNGPPRGGSGRREDYLVMRNFSSYQESGSRKVDEGMSGRDERKRGLFGKTFTGFRRSAGKTPGWMG